MQNTGNTNLSENTESGRVSIPLQRELDEDIAMSYCHKHGQGLATVRCDKCDDELIALDKIKELERLLKDCADELSLNIAYCKNAPTIKNRAWQLHDKIRNVIGED